MSSTTAFTNDAENDLFDDMPDLELTSDSDYSNTESESEESNMEAFNNSDSELTNDGLDETPSDTHENDPSIYQKTFVTLAFLDQINFKVVDFLDALSWGNGQCTQDPKVRSERTVLLQSPKLTKILNRWAHPPRPPGSKKKRPEGAQSVMKEFAVNQVGNVTNRELEELAEDMVSPTSEDVLEETLTATTFNVLEEQITEKAPVLWKVLHTLGSRPRQKKNVHKDPTKIIIIMISMLSYIRSHHRCRLQKLLAIYLKFKGISAKGFDMLHAIALTMSHKWTTDAVEQISKECMDDVKALMEIYSWVLSYDNMQVSFRVFSQRLDDKGEFGNGSAATVYIKRDATPMSPEANKNLKQKHAEGMKNPLTEEEIFDLANNSYPCIYRHMAYQALRFILESPEFDLKTYQYRDSELLKAPPPVDELPCGKEHVTLQYLLGSVTALAAIFIYETWVVTQ